MPIFSIKKTVLSIVLASIVGLPFAVKAQIMQSQQYQLESEDVTTESTDQGTVSSGVPLNSIDLKEFNQKGFISSSNTSDFSFLVDTDNLSFGPISQNSSSSVSEGMHVLSSTGYQVNLSEIRPLTSLGGAEIKNTICDKVCSANHAEIWQSKQSEGLGYTVQGNGAPEDFLNLNYYRALADSSKNQLSSLLFKDGGTEKIVDLHLVLKLNTTSQNTENYSTIINIEAFPAY